MLLGKVTSVHPPQVEHGNETVKLIVGPQQKEFTIHKNLICVASEFFKAALASNFVEGNEQKVVLPEDDPQYFQVIYDWLYSGRVAGSVSTYLKKEDICAGDIFWWKLYQIGDRLMIERLRMLAIDKIQNLFSGKNPFVPSKMFIAELCEDGKLPGLETYMTEHVIHWLQLSKDPAVWNVLPDAHPRFAEALAKESISALKFSTPHPERHTDVAKVDGFLSPWKIAGVTGGPIQSTGGGTEMRERHLSENSCGSFTNPLETDKTAGKAKVTESKVNLKPEDPKKEQAHVGQSSKPLNAPHTDIPVAEPKTLKTRDARLLVSLYFPKDGILYEDDLKFLLRTALEAAELKGVNETAEWERRLSMLGLTPLSITLSASVWFENNANLPLRLSGRAQWDRLDRYHWTDQERKAMALCTEQNNANGDGWGPPGGDEAPAPSA